MVWHMFHQVGRCNKLGENGKAEELLEAIRTTQYFVLFNYRLLDSMDVLSKNQIAK